MVFSFSLLTVCSHCPSEAGYGIGGEVTYELIKEPRVEEHEGRLDKKAYAEQHNNNEFSSTRCHNTFILS
jgi:hypothetical protein